MAPVRRALLALCIALLAPSAFAQDESLSDLQQAQLDRLRAEMASQIQLQAFDLVDELVYGWIEQPVFGVDTPVVLADVTVPVGFGSGMEALIENHFAGLLVKHPKTRVQLSHCPQCNAMIVHSGAKGTIISRGVDQPEALVQAGGLSGSRHALYLDFEAEGSALVLRARITALEPALPIVYARTLSTSTSSAALLRSEDRLTSAAEARKEYLDALQGRGLVRFPVRLLVRSYAQSDESTNPVASVPHLWLQAGAEMSLTPARAWTATLSGGATYMPQLHFGWMAQARVARLLSGSAVALNHPDIYAFAGLSIISIYGASADVFGTEIPTAQQILDAARNERNPNVLFGAYQLGMEVRLNKVGLGAYLEMAPALDNSPNIGRHLDFGFVSFHNFGVEVTFCF